MNRNKRSITVNFKQPEGLEIVHKLVEQSDVLVENFVSGKLAEMGLGWEDCQRINPRLIYASITGECIACVLNLKPTLRRSTHALSGYGQTGPYRKAAGYDVIVEAEAGLMHMWVSFLSGVSEKLRQHSTGEPDGPPCKVGVAATDIATGLYAHGAIMAGLLSRAKTGKGVWIDCNLFESQVSACTFISPNCAQTSVRW